VDETQIGLSTWRVPIMVAVSPRYVTSERSEHVEETPGYDHVVVDAGKQRYTEHAPTDTCSSYIQFKRFTYSLFYATADEAVAYMFYRCFFVIFSDRKK